MIVATLVALLLSGCAGKTRNADGTYPESQKSIPFQDFDENSKADSAAYVVDAMHVRRPMPSHADWEPLDFYYKHCTKINEKAHYPKGESFECSKPY